MNESFRLVLILSNMWAKIEDMSLFECYQPWKLCTTFCKIINHTVGNDISFHWIIQLRNMSWHIMAQFMFQGIHKFDTEFFIEQCQCLYIRISFVRFQKRKKKPIPGSKSTLETTERLKIAQVTRLSWTGVKDFILLCIHMYEHFWVTCVGIFNK